MPADPFLHGFQEQESNDVLESALFTPNQSNTASANTTSKQSSKSETSSASTSQKETATTTDPVGNQTDPGPGVDFNPLLALLFLAVLIIPVMVVFLRRKPQQAVVSLLDHNPATRKTNRFREKVRPADLDRPAQILANPKLSDQSPADENAADEIAEDEPENEDPFDSLIEPPVEPELEDQTTEEADFEPAPAPSGNINNEENIDSRLIDDHARLLDDLEIARCEVEKHEFEIASLKEKNQLLIQQAIDLQKQLDDSQNLANSESAKQGQLNAEIARLNDQLTAAAREYEMLGQQQTIALQEKDELGRERDQARQQAETLSQQLESAKQEVPQEILDEIQAFRTNFDSISGEKSDLEKELESSRNQHQDLQGRLAEKDARLQEMQEAITSARDTVPEKTLRELDELRGQLRDSREDVEKLQRQLKESLDDKSVFQKQYLETDAALNQAQQDLEDARAEVPESIQREWDQQAESLNQAVAEEIARRKQLEEELASVRQELEESVASADTDVGVDADHSALVSKLDAKRVKLRRVKAKLREKLALVEKLHKENRQLKRTVAKQSNSEAPEVADLQSRNNELEDELAQLRSGFEQLESTAGIAHVESENRFRNLEQKLSTADANNRLLQNEVRELRDAAASAESVFQQRLAKHEEEVLASRQESLPDVGSISSRFADLESTNQELEEKLADAHQVLTRERVDKAAMIQALDEARELISRHESEPDHPPAEDIREMMQIIARQNRKIAKLERSLDTSKSVASGKKSIGGRKKKKTDDLQQIIGIGPVFESRLNKAGITTFRQIAGWNPEEVADFGKRIDAPRISDDDWVGQARRLLDNKSS